MNGKYIFFCTKSIYLLIFFKTLYSAASLEFLLIPLELRSNPVSYSDVLMKYLTVLLAEIFWEILGVNP